uniref:Integrase catalytic domain-containing protein n=1 Tax=Trichogramma kaykai TaxID=54128 RepID=A0ABD2X4Q8_9HYME
MSQGPCSKTVLFAKIEIHYNASTIPLVLQQPSPDCILADQTERRKNYYRFVAHIIDECSRYICLRSCGHRKRIRTSQLFGKLRPQQRNRILSLPAAQTLTGKLLAVLLILCCITSMYIIKSIRLRIVIIRLCLELSYENLDESKYGSRISAI